MANPGINQKSFWKKKVPKSRVSHIPNRLELLTRKVQTLLTTIPQNYCKLLLQLNSNLNYLLQDKTQLNATSNSLNKINMKTKESSRNKLKKSEAFEKDRRKLKAKHGSSYEKIKNIQQKKDTHENPMMCSSLKWSVFLSHTK